MGLHQLRPVSGRRSARAAACPPQDRPSGTGRVWERPRHSRDMAGTPDGQGRLRARRMAADIRCDRRPVAGAVRQRLHRHSPSIVAVNRQRPRARAPRWPPAIRGRGIVSTATLERRRPAAAADPPVEGAAGIRPRIQSRVSRATRTLRQCAPSRHRRRRARQRSRPVDRRIAGDERDRMASEALRGGGVGRQGPESFVSRRTASWRIAHIRACWTSSSHAGSERFGAAILAELHASLRALFHPADDGPPRISEGLAPPPGVRRSGDAVGALGALGLVPAEQKRVREMAAQAAAFVDDPAAVFRTTRCGT